MGAFAGMKDAKRGFSNNYLRSGTYVLRLDSCQHFVSDRKKARMWKNTVTVLGVELGTHKVGEVATIAWKEGEYPEVFLMNIKRLIAGIANITDEECDEEKTEMVLGPDNPLAGKVTVATGVDKVSKQNKPFVEWTFSAALSDDEIVAAIGEEGVKRFFPNGL